MGGPFTVFNGTLDGNNKKITGLTITGGSYTGLVGYAGSSATIKDIDLESVTPVKASTYVGTLAGVLNGTTIENIDIEGNTVEGMGYVGGMAGYSTIPMNNYEIKNITINKYGPRDYKYYGGLFGYTTKSLDEIFVKNTIVNGRSNTGSVVGYTTGNFSLSIDGEKQNITMDYNYIPPIYDAIPYLKFDASKLTLGQHNFDLNFSGDEYQNASSLSGTFTVSPIILKAPSNLHLLNTYENNRDALDNRGYIMIKYLKNMTGNAYLYINGVKKTINLSNFKAKGDMGSEYDGYSCYMYDWQKYNLINYWEDEKCYVYKEYYTFLEPANITLKYKGINKSAFVNATYDVNCYNEIVKGNNLEIFIPKEISGKVTVKIDGKKTNLYTKRIDADYYRLKYYVKTSSLNYGKHRVTITSPLYTVSKTFSVVDEYVSPKSVYMYYTDGKKMTFTVYGEGRTFALKGDYIDITLDKKYYLGTYAKKNGKVSVKIPKNLKPGTHTINFINWGDFGEYTGKVKLVVKHLVTLKSAKVKKSAKKLVLTATLKKGKTALKSKQMTFKFAGKTYKAKTNSKGIAKVTVKSSMLNKLKIGKKITYQATYLKDTVKKTTKVKK